MAIRRIAQLLTLTTLALGCRPAAAPTPNDATPATADGADAADQTDDQGAQRKRILAAKQALFERLSGRLREAMQTQGPAAAIEVCHREAPEIAKEVGAKHKVAIGRTALKRRNPNNVAPTWAEPLIERRTTTPEFVDLPDGRLGALLPIKLQAQCLMCHGSPEDIPEIVRARLDELYPDDQAVGFAEGDLRGWFWVESPPRTTQLPGP
ncbi:MAG: DUF3365 domain-containing protein [Planctomycetales bacterium]|nr:DUF3365 domain-containing protein [Planctomycetales bacterium]